MAMAVVALRPLRDIDPLSGETLWAAGDVVEATVDGERLSLRNDHWRADSSSPPGERRSLRLSQC
ncbi:hypothetical protein GCM10022200_26420 [Microbacterium awajiense]|uniref:Uncharacterized protein n=1 Tax=Microbacterium awajiense TaxID=415214 RepID=A0ABP7AVY1_9MICO